MFSIVKAILFIAVLHVFKLMEWLASCIGLLSHTNVGTQSTVEVRNILCRYRSTTMELASPNNFISWPTGTCDKTAVLKDNISLYCVTNSQAWFVETPVDVDVYSSDTDPFFYSAQYKWAQRLYVVPLDVLVALGDLVGNPKVPVVLLSSHGRCGSTLLAQAFETVPGAVTLAEPDSLTSVLFLKWKDMSTADQLRLIVPAIMKILCRTTSRTVSLYCIKTRSVAIAFVDIIAQEMPEVKHLYMYRDCASTVSSMERSFSRTSGLTVLWFKFTNSKLGQWIIAKLTGNQSMAMCSVFETFSDRYKPFNMSYVGNLSYGMWFILWAMACAEYLRLRRIGIDIVGVRYEDLISRTQSVIKGLTQHTGIKLDCDIIAGQLLKRDSQRGTSLSQERLKSYDRLVLDDTSREQMQFICSKMGLPAVEHNEETLLEGTIGVN